MVERNTLTDRVLEVMQNVLSYINSYNFDNSNVMVDYFHVNFHLNISIGNDLNPYKLEIPKLKAPKGSVIPSFMERRMNLMPLHSTLRRAGKSIHDS
jgi:hypothetical protein